MAVATKEIVRAACRLTCSSGEIINVYHFRGEFASTQSDDAVMDAIVESLTTAYAQLNDHLHVGVTPVDIKMDVVAWVGTPVKETIVRSLGVRSWGDDFDPSGSGDDLPPGVCALVKFRTPGVRTLLRKFLGVLTEADRQGGGWTSTFVTALTNFGIAMLLEVPLSPGNLMFYGTHSKRSASFVQAISFTISTVEAYQRRRKFGVGA